jgi:hypothetical protein
VWPAEKIARSIRLSLDFFRREIAGMLSTAISATEQDGLNRELHWIKHWRNLRREAAPFVVHRNRINVSATRPAEPSFLLRAVEAADLKHVRRYADVIRASGMS